MILVSFCALACLLSVAEGCYGEFTAELRGMDIHVGVICRGSCTGATDTQNTSCTHLAGSVKPYVQVYTCLETIAGDLNTTSVNMSHTIVAHVSRSNCSTGECTWRLNLPESFFNVPCIDVHVAAFVTSVPPLRGVRKRIWLSSREETVHEFTCDGVCSILGTSTYNARVTVALVQQGEFHYLHYVPQESYMYSATRLPSCLHNSVLLQWTVVTATLCSGEHRPFSPLQVYAASATEVFITGSNALLYSACRDCQLFQLLLPLSVNISSFSHFSERLFALLSTSNETVGLWLGITGQSPVLQVYPNTQLMWLWNSSNTSAPDPASLFAGGALRVDEQNNLVIVSEGAVVWLPLPLLFAHAVYQYHAAQAALHNVSLDSTLQLLTDQSHFTLSDQPHRLLLESQFPLLCPLVNVLLAAPVCGKVTRSDVQVVEDGALRWLSRGALPWENCSVMADTLPPDIFLGLGSGYTFTVQLVLNPLLTAGIGTDQLWMAFTVSEPDVVEVMSERTHHAVNSTVEYKVSFVERNLTSTQQQVPSGSVIRSVDVRLWVQNIGMECVHPLEPHLRIPGHFHTRVHTGCPPGLSLEFDVSTTQARANQYCSSSNDVSCYYFGNEFRPVFQLVDAVTGERSTYTGPYTLRILAGGTSRSDMLTFNPQEKIESKIWTAESDSILSHSGNRIKWVCGMKSPCGEIIPGGGQSPEYYLQLQASNRVVDREQTYCDLTVEFTIRVHGMSMGPITTSVTLILLLVALVAPLLSLFPLWFWNERLEKKWQGILGRVKQVAGQVGEHIVKTVRQQQQRLQRPVEPHLHTN